MKTRNSSSQSGVVLIAVLWGVMLLAAIAFSLAVSVRTGVDELHRRKESLQAHYLARGGILRAAVLMTHLQNPSAPSEYKPGQRFIEWNDEMGRVTVEVVEEGGKIDVNQASEKTLQQLFEGMGLEFNDARALAAAIEDWRGAPGAVTRSFGADDSYYLSLPEPYHLANADFKSIEELLLVRGVTEDLFYGGYVVRDDGSVERRLGLVDCLTVHGTGQAVNINFAPYPVLMAMPQMEQQVANYILSGRQQAPFASVSDITRQFPVSLSAVTLSFLTTQGGGYVSLIGTGYAPDGVTARVRALVKVRSEDDVPFRFVTWDDSYVH
jgi:general secretion pathway protein K